MLLSDSATNAAEASQSASPKDGFSPLRRPAYRWATRTRIGGKVWRTYARNQKIDADLVATDCHTEIVFILAYTLQIGQFLARGEPNDQSAC
jgi:hypothetical protein